jgi:hypothetical protein
LKLHCVFLRKECVLPNRLDPLREACGEHWSLLKEITAPIFDTMIREMGWHFLWVHRPCTRKGFGLTQEAATRRALGCALNGVARRFNASELINVKAGRFFGLHSITVTVQPRQIQQYTWLEVAEDWHRLAVPFR